MDATLRVMIQAAQAGGTVIRRYFGKTLEVVVKSNYSDYQTKADVGSERAIVSLLKKKFPDHALFAEEETKTHGKNGWQFIIDPLDGTNNFMLGVPYVGVSIALVHHDRMEYGVVHHAMLNETYHAKRNGGAYKNTRRIHVSTRATVEDATVAICMGYSSSPHAYVRMFSRAALSNVKRVTNEWSPALDLCAVADSRLEGIIIYENELYDFAAGKLIAQEAGARITDVRGKKESKELNDCFLVSNGKKNIHALLQKVAAT